MVQRDSDQGRKGRQVLKTDLVGVQELLVIVRHLTAYCVCKWSANLFWNFVCVCVCVCSVDNSDLS